MQHYHLTRILAAGSERQKLLYLDTLSNDTCVNISHNFSGALNKPGATRLSLTTILQRKGRALDAMADQFGVLRQRLDPEGQALLDKLVAARSRLAAIFFQSSEQSPPTHSRAEVLGLEAEIEQLETRVSALSQGFNLQSQPITLEAVQQAIPAGAALVEVVVYHPYNLKNRASGKKWGGAARYAAYILRREGQPSAVDLGETEAINHEVVRLRRALLTPEGEEHKQAARALDELVMRPLRKLLSETRMLLLSPDGLLNLVPFGALVDEQQRYLIENYTFAYLTSGRDLLRLSKPSSERQSPLVIADPRFDAASTPLPHTPSAPAAPSNARGSDGLRGRRAGEMGRMAWDRLKWASDEANALKTILNGAVILTGEQATEAAVKRAKGPRVLHISTHGFFLPDQAIRHAAQGGDGTARLSADENPLLRSGLVLAGANTLQGGEGEDGYLTSLEVAGLDLWGTRLVVLSACETGVGDIRTGDGVYGLRRALTLAGAESQLMSLWQVDDRATHELMVSYYEQLLAGGERAEALRQVQLQLLKRRDRTHPYFWAGFIPIGDWRAMVNKK